MGKKRKDELGLGTAGDRPRGVVNRGVRELKFSLNTVVVRCATSSARTTRVRNSAAVVDDER